jgi:hypothetical protein
MTLVFAPLLAVFTVWLYTLIFAFAALWFAHFTLGELHRLRGVQEAAAQPAAAPPQSAVRGTSSPDLQAPSA